MCVRPGAVVFVYSVYRGNKRVQVQVQVRGRIKETQK